MDYKAEYEKTLQEFYDFKHKLQKEPKKLYEELQLCKSRFSEFLNLSHDSIYRWKFQDPMPVSLDKNRQLEWALRNAYLASCNDVYASLFGFKSAKDAIGSSLVKVLGNEKRAIGLLQFFIEQNYKWTNTESWEKDLEGNQFCFINNVFGVIIHNKLTEIWGTQVDITEKKNLEAELKENEKRFQLVMEATQDGIFDWNLDTNEIYYSPGWKKMLGYDDHELKNKFSVWEELTHPDDVKKSWEKLNDHIQGKTKRFEMELRMMHKNGNWVNILSRANAITNEKGAAYRVIGTHIDITSRLKVHQELINEKNRAANILEGTNAGTWDWNIQTGELTIDERWAEIIGYSKSELAPIDWGFLIHLMHPADYAKADALLQKHFNGELDYFSVEFRQKHKEGFWKWINSRGKVIEWTKEGKPLRMYGTHLDISERIETKKELLLQEERYKRLSEATFEGIVLTNQRVIIDVNHQLCDMFGYLPDEIKSLELNKLIHPDDTEAVMKHNLNNDTSPFVHRGVKKDGSTLYLEMRSDKTFIDNEECRIIVIRDITDYRNKQIALKESEERFQAFMKRTPVFGYIKDEKLNYIYRNKRIEDLFGTYLQNIDESPSGIDKQETKKIKAAEKRILSEKSKTEILEYKLNIQGESIWLRDLKFPLPVSNGKTYVGGIAVDITESKHYEKAIEDSFTKFKTLADYTYDWEYWIDNNGKFMYISPSCERISGYGPEAFINSPKLFDEIILPEDKPIWEIHKKNVTKQIPCENPLEIRIKTKNGETKWINHVCRPVYDTHSNHIGSRGTNRDITLQKMSQIALSVSEMNFKQLADLTFEGIVVHKNGIIQNVNQSLLNMSGYSIEDLQGIDIIQTFVPEKYHKLVRDKMQETNKAPYEIEIIKKDRQLLPVEITAREISKKDRIRVVSIRDITEQKQIQQKILNTIIQTEEKERKWIAQELHDGLGPVLSIVKLYMQTYINSTDKSFKEKIKTQLLASIDEALEQTSAISNNLSPQVLNDFGLQVALQKFIKKVNDIQAVHIDFIYDCTISIDKDIEITLYRVTIELINNTIKHAKANKVMILIQGIRNDIALTYTDDGIGFDFENAKNGKTGMGLFNITNRIKSLGGEVHFESPNDNGVLYKIALHNGQ